jgi:hypothetical protein
MANKTLPTLVATSALADTTLFLVRRSGQTDDEKTTGADLKTLLYGSVAITGGTIDATTIGGTTPAAADFTTLVSTSIDTGQGAVECYAMDQDVRSTAAVSFASVALTTDLAVIDGGTGSSTASGARTNLGLGTAAVQADTYFLQAANNLSDITVAATARTNLGLGSLATLSTIDNSLWSGTDLAVVNGGTGASTASDARTNLGVIIGTDVQAQDAGLQSIAGLTTAANKMIYTTASDVYAVTDLTAFAITLLDDADAGTARATLGLGTIATQASSSVSITGGSITGITDVAVADGGTGASTAGGARTNLGLGSMAEQASTSVSISGGTITGISDIAIADGGTGASTASAAFDNLKQAATTTSSGVVEAATEAEMESETSGKYPDASQVRNSPGVAKAWVQFDGTGTVSVTNSYNITSVSDNAVGNYTITIADNFANSNYTATASGWMNSSTGICIGLGTYTTAVTKNSGTLRADYINQGGVLADFDAVYVTFHGDQ